MVILDGAGRVSEIEGIDSPRPQGRMEEETLSPTGGRDTVAGYSRLVVLLKLLFPAVAAVLIGLVAVWPHLQPQDKRFRIGFKSAETQQAEEPSMVNARYHGTDKDFQPFTVSADIAKNLVNADKAVELEMPKADIALKDGSWLVLTAETGLYSKNDKKLSLQGAVNLFHDSGYEFRTVRADMDLDQGIAEGHSHVEGQGPFGDLEADGFRILEKGKVIVFIGKSKLVIYKGIGDKRP